MNQNQDLRVPAFCPLCSKMMKGKSTFSFYECGTCISCKIFFVEGREARWATGWRPDEEEMKRYELWLAEN